MAKVDLYNQITDNIIATLEAGTPPWTRKWNSKNFIPLRSNGSPYRGINTIILWLEGMVKNYKSPYWMTFKQAKDFGGFVRKGEKSTCIVFYSPVVKNEINESGEEDEKIYRLLRSYNVFNVDQIENLPAKFYDIGEVNPDSQIDDCEQFFNNINAIVEHGGSRAFYTPTSDMIVLPKFEDFHSAVDYYSTRAHETIHWTGHHSRLNRNLNRNRFGDEAYAFEELVAEIGAAFINAELNINSNVRDDHAAYIASWIKVLKNDKKAIFTAAAMAQKAVDYINKKTNTDEENEG